MNKEKLTAFHGKDEIKEKYIQRVKEHQEADRIVKGKYWEDGKGCAVGCTIESSEHKKYETELGIPEILAHLEDGLFEEMPNEEAMKWPLKFLEAIPVGADLSMVFTKLVIWEWEDETYGLKNIKEIKDDKELFDLCEDVTKLYKRHLDGEKVEVDEWQRLEDLVWELERSRAWAWSWARSRAWAWARARSWAWDWARARAWAWDWARARARSWAWARSRAWAGKEYDKQILIASKKLLELLRDAK